MVEDPEGSLPEELEVMREVVMVLQETNIESGARGKRGVVLTFLLLFSFRFAELIGWLAGSRVHGQNKKNAHPTFVLVLSLSTRGGGTKIKEKETEKKFIFNF